MFNTQNVIKHVILGNQVAFRWVYNEYVEMVYRLAIHIVKEDVYADEIVQDTFLQLWHSRERLDPQTNIKTLLFVICRNNSFNKLKVIRRQRERFMAIDDKNLDSSLSFEEEPMAEKDLREALEAIISKLPPKQQTIFRLSRIEGLSHKEIAEQLHISKNTVKNHVIAALKSVKTELNHLRTQSSVFALISFYLFYS